jgi:hypothetical protein
VVTGVGSSERADPARGVSFTAAERVRLVRRNVALLVAAQGMAWTALPIFATVGPSAAFGLSGHERSVGIMVALYGLAEAGGALIAGRVMDRLGRRVGLAAGYALLAVGGGRAAWILQSRANWLCISQLCVPLGERAGANRYQQNIQFISRLPIPHASGDEREAICALVMEITEYAGSRYELHQKTHRRILSDLGVPGKKLNQKLTAWWELDFPAFRAEVKKVFKHDIPLDEHDEWEEWLAGRRAEHEALTAEIVRLETDLNARVYHMFNLTPEEIQTIEESTSYRYGEV